MTDEPRHPVLDRYCDVAVIGGSAAGLAAALQLARQRRSVVVVDDGTPRNTPAEHTHGYLGREGTPPAQLVAIGREEVRGYGGEVLAGRVLAVHPRDGDRFRLDLTGGHGLLTRRVLAATGLADELPGIEGLAERWGRDVVHCPFCHGYEVRDQRLVQIVDHPTGLQQTPLWRHLTDRLTLLLHDAAGITESALAPLIAAGVPVVHQEARRILGDPGEALGGVELADGSVLAADAVVLGSRFRARAETLAYAGVATSTHPTGLGDVVEVDQSGETSVPGIFAAGNLTDPGMQVLPAAAHGSRVGAMIAFALAGEDLHAGGRTDATVTDWDQRYGTGDRVWSRNPNGTLVSEVAGLVPGRALDVGAGEGADALWLAEQGWDVTACDISGNALARLGAEAEHRGLAVRCLRADVNDADALGADAYGLVSLQYGSFHRSPDGRGLRSLLGAVAPGGTLIVVGHDLGPLQAPIDVSTQTRMYDPEAYVGIEQIAATLRDTAGWRIEANETRPRPLGAVSTHHVADVVLRATRR